VSGTCENVETSPVPGAVQAGQVLGVRPAAVTVAKGAIALIVVVVIVVIVVAIRVRDRVAVKNLD